MKKLFYTVLFFLLTVLLLLYPADCLGFALTGLNLWFQKMVPTLLPFMILSGMMIRMELTEKIVFLLRPLLEPVFRLRSTLLFAVVVGFLCGFPMGARVTADLYTRRKITRSEADYLLAFSNNIGPIYFTGFALPALGLKKTVPYLIGMYGLPLFYGLLLRFTVYRRQLSSSLPDVELSAGAITSSQTPATPPFCLKAAVNETFSEKNAAIKFFCKKRPAIKTFFKEPLTMSLPEALDESIIAGMEGITKLGGYMIFFNLLNIIPRILWPHNFRMTTLLGCFLEITGGISLVRGILPVSELSLIGGVPPVSELSLIGVISHANRFPLFSKISHASGFSMFSKVSTVSGFAQAGSLPSTAVLILLSFGGLSCLAQTNSCIRQTGLSLRTYTVHKLILTLFSFLYYLFL